MRTMAVIDQPIDAVKLGVFSLNEGATVRPHALAEVAVLAEDLGYESLWMGEHPVLPDPPGSQSWLSPQIELVDPLSALTYVAAVTSRIRLATGIIILPLRNPVVLAKGVASLDVLSEGRFTLGVGMGYIERQAAAVGVPWQGRVARGQEHIEAMRALWRDKHPEYHGEYVDFERVDAYPRPVREDVPIVIGGHAPRALRLAATHAQGWYGFNLPPQAVPGALRQIEHEAAVHGRPAELGPLEVTVTPPRGPVSPATLARYAAAGVHRVVLFPQLGLSLAQTADYVRRHAPGAA